MAKVSTSSTPKKTTLEGGHRFAFPFVSGAMFLVMGRELLWLAACALQDKASHREEHTIDPNQP